MRNLVSFILLLAATSCSRSDNSSQAVALPGQQLPAKESAFDSLPRTYWPVDHKVARSQATVPGLEQYQVTVVTTCLNDSAVVNPITLDTGAALDVSHNYESELSIYKGAALWQHARLTKALFQHNAVALALGPLSELALSRTIFLNYRAPEFRFTTRLGMPDSDIFVEAEVAMVPDKGLRLVSVHEQALEAE